MLQRDRTVAGATRESSTDGFPVPGLVVCCGASGCLLWRVRLFPTAHPPDASARRPYRRQCPLVRPVGGQGIARPTFAGPGMSDKNVATARGKEHSCEEGTNAKMNWPGFVHPWMLAGLAAAGLPVLIHFLTRARPRRIAFPPYQFLMEACAGQQSLHRLRTILLLSCASWR